MAEIKNKSSLESELKKIPEEKIIIGSNKVLKELRKGNVKKIYLASNIPKDKESELKHLSNISKTEIHKSELNSKYLGPLVKKMFNVLVIGIKK